MPEHIARGRIVGWETAPEIYAEQIVGINIHENTVIVTLAVNRIEPGKGADAQSVRAVVGRLVLPFTAANELVRQLNAASAAVALDDAPVPSGSKN